MRRPRWTQSEFERRLLGLLGPPASPCPSRSSRSFCPNGQRVYLDFAWPDVRLALEAQSYRHHAGRLAWSRDQLRTAMLTSMGWRMLPVTWEDLGAPDELIATVCRALGRIEAGTLW